MLIYGDGKNEDASLHVHTEFVGYFLFAIS